MVMKFENEIINEWNVSTFVRMLKGFVGGLIGVSMSLTKLSSRLDFFFIIYLPGMSLIQMTELLD